MAYYNTSIWMVMILAIVGLPSAVLTDDKINIPEEKLIDQLKYVQELNKGRFTSPQTEIKGTDEVGNVLLTAIQELDCNYTYDMLVFMNLITPKNYTTDYLNQSVYYECSYWAQNMLIARIKSNIPFKGVFPYSSWMFFLYMKKMKMFAKHDAKIEMNELHGYVEAHLKLEMVQCIHLWPKDYEYCSYTDELTSLDPNTALEKLTKTCTHLSMLSKSKLAGLDDFDSSLYINYVVEDSVIMNTLVTSFGGLEDGNQFPEYLLFEMKKVNDPMSTLSDYIHSLRRVHSNFMLMVKTIMLRLTWLHLGRIKLLKWNMVAEHLEVISYENQFIEFANLFKLNKENDFMEVMTDVLAIKDREATLNTGQRLSAIVSLLRKYNTKKDVLRSKDRKRQILTTVNCQTSALMQIAKGIDYIPKYNINIRSIEKYMYIPRYIEYNESFLCTEVFVKYFKKILIVAEFNIFELFEVFDILVSERESVLNHS